MSESHLDLTSTVVQTEGIFAAEMGRELAMLNVERGYYHILNPTAHAVWRRLEKPARVADVCESLRGEFEVDRATCDEDTVALLGELLDEGLVRVVECGS
jgi:hypothetical protein